MKLYFTSIHSEQSQCVLYSCDLAYHALYLLLLIHYNVKSFIVQTFISKAYKINKRTPEALLVVSLPLIHTLSIIVRKSACTLYWTRLGVIMGRGE